MKHPYIYAVLITWAVMIPINVMLAPRGIAGTIISFLDSGLLAFILSAWFVRIAERRVNR